jgi:translation initiation factor IF-1
MVEIMQQVVRQELVRRRTSLLGVVTAVFAHTDADDDNNYEVDLRLKHEDLELRKVPVAIGHVGVAAPARVDDLVLVEFVDGDLNQPLVVGRFYHADERPPLHHEDEVLFEQRVPDGTLNQLRFTDDGSIYLQRDVTKPEDNSEAKATIRIDGASGDVRITAGDAIVVDLTNDSELRITCDGKPLVVTCDSLTITCDSGMTVEGDVQINGDLQVSGAAGSTTISGHEIKGA